MTDYRRGPDAATRRRDEILRARLCKPHSRRLLCPDCAEIARVRAAEIREQLTARKRDDSLAPEVER